MKTILVDAVYCLIIQDETGSHVFEAMHRMLEEFPNPKILLTGANDEQFKEWNLPTAPYEVFTLKHNPEKTDPEYFRRLLAHLSLTAADVVYFEHNPAAVASAESLGIKSYHYDEHKADLAVLKVFLMANL